jgi:hypothetical protein
MAQDRPELIQRFITQAIKRRAKAMGLFTQAKAQSSERREEQQMNKIKSGGGIQSNKLVKPSVRTGQPPKGTSPAAADYLGQATAFRKENVGVGPAYQASKLGNEVALNVGAGAPGAGRTVHHCGSQGVHGKPDPGNPPPAGKDIISEFGPDIPGRNYKR